MSITVGLFRPPGVFFFEIDYFAFRRLKALASKYLRAFSIFKTKHGYHLMGTPFSMRIWRIFKRNFKTDYTMKLRKRWISIRKVHPQVLRIAPKWSTNEGIEVSPKPRKVFCSGNFQIENDVRYRVAYYCK